MPSEATDRTEAPQDSKLYTPDSGRKEGEIFWVNHQPFLASRGYMLRPRYHADWVPSWQSNPRPKKFGVYYEDQHIIHYSPVRLRLAYIVQLLGTIHLALADHRCDTYLGWLSSRSQAELKDNPRNHAIPLLDVIQFPDENWALLVKAMFRYFASPNFHCVSEFIELFRQLLAGLEFMNRLNIAHGDITINDIVMDHRRVIAKGIHFAMDGSHDGATRGLFTELRVRVAPVNYYYIDFEFAQCFPEGIEVAAVPKLSFDGSYGVPNNPFKEDVYDLDEAIFTTLKWRIWNTPYRDPTYPPPWSRLPYYLFPSRHLFA
ncbi:uncharacterized protein BT62DRAFT_1080212 [Guyanagaster necrorhizus]|uniref:Protein kinase domain-containing protein n=1 Tax=Guyanagaster necrorhizus TaxID=856835 RepID=A0A9P8AN32_9AGAR|nr:uncharacterized protein BT62DRAFT_1080212 [Guyanagaster necrorhizus MCA 3950]KAG7441336.1 hypothetical protein BT62DRAFT_1080212 [Guyanagaster necrorhizus MCA 3950]